MGLLSDDTNAKAEGPWKSPHRVRGQLDDIEVFRYSTYNDLVIKALVLVTFHPVHAPYCLIDEFRQRALEEIASSDSLDEVLECEHQALLVRHSNEDVCFRKLTQLCEVRLDHMRGYMFKSLHTNRHVKAFVRWDIVWCGAMEEAKRCLFLPLLPRNI